jgi:hypothetical protein
VRIADVRSLGWSGVVTAAALIVVVRPLNVWLSTINCKLNTKKRLFIAWIGPRGIIAAAVASLFAETLDAKGIAGGQQLKALVFLVIAITVVLAGLTGGPVAKLLKLTRLPRGWLFLGANALAVTVATILQRLGEEVTVLDRSVDHCSLATQFRVPVVQGNGLDDDVLKKAHISLRAGVAAVTPNDEVNLLFIQKARDAGRVSTRYAALTSLDLGASRKMVHQDGGYVLFADEYDLERWMALLRHDEAAVHELTAGSVPTLSHEAEAADLAIPLVLKRGSTVRPIADDVDVKEGDKVYFAVRTAAEKEAMTWLHTHGWQSA